MSKIFFQAQQIKVIFVKAKVFFVVITYNNTNIKNNMTIKKSMQILSPTVRYKHG